MEQVPAFSGLEGEGIMGEGRKEAARGGDREGGVCRGEPKGDMVERRGAGEII